MVLKLEIKSLSPNIKAIYHHHKHFLFFYRNIRVWIFTKISLIVNLPEFLWRCILWKHLEKSLAVILGCMSFAILLAEATILTSGVDLSLFSILVHAAGEQEVLVQVILVDLFQYTFI